MSFLEARLAFWLRVRRSGKYNIFINKPNHNMKVVLESNFGELNFRGTNERGQSIQLSGNKEAVGPMETVLMAMAACSAIDVEMILKKMRQKCQDIRVEVDATRADAVPAVFTKIQLNYTITGAIKEDKARQAVEMSMTQYCSVSKMIEKSAEISWKVKVIVPEWNDQM